MKKLIYLLLLILTISVVIRAQSGGAGTAASLYKTVYANLGSPADGSVRYCTDCSATSPCTGGGGGATAARVANTWNCSTGGGGTGSVTPSSTDNFSNKTITDATNNVTADHIRSSASLPSTSAVGDVYRKTGTSAGLYKDDGSSGWSQLWAADINTIVAERNAVGVDAGANDTYVITLSPSPAAYVVGDHIRFFANTVNTGAATINVNALGALTIVKIAGGITTTLANGDIPAGSWVDCTIAAGSNCQITSNLGNAASAGGLTVGTTTIASGTTMRILYDNAGTLGEYTISGSGTVVALAAAPVFTTPTLGVAAATSIATPIVGPAADSTTALKITKADLATVVGVWDTTNTRLRIGSGVAPTATLDVTGAITLSSTLTMGAGTDIINTGRMDIAVPAASQVNISNSPGTGLQKFTIGSNQLGTPIGTAPTHNQAYGIIQAEELLTIAAASSTTTTMQVPANAVVLSVSVRVTTVIPTATTFTVTIGSISFHTAAVSTALNTTDPGTNPVNTISVYPFIPSAAGVTITPNLTPAAGTGVVRVTVTYYLAIPPSS